MWTVYYYHIYLYYAILFDNTLAVAVRFKQSVYFAEEGQDTTGIRLEATRFEIPFSVQVFAVALNSSRREEIIHEAKSGELIILLVLADLQCQMSQYQYYLHTSL